MKEIFHYNKLIALLHKWRDKARYQSAKRDEELVWYIRNLNFLETKFCYYIDVALDNNAMCEKY